MPVAAAWSAAVFIKPRSLEILHGLDLIDEFLERGQIVDGVDVYLGARPVGSYRFRDLDTPFPYILSIPEEQTIDILSRKLTALSGQVERGVEFFEIDQTGEAVVARLKSDAGTYTIKPQWVVGTDGYHSAVRHAVDDRFEGRDYSELWGVVDSKIENWRHPRNITCAQLRPPNVIAFPNGKDGWRIYFRPATPSDETLEIVNRGLALVSPGAKPSELGEPQFFRSHSRLARQYRRGRVFLAGDAAHGSNPIEGHGMNVGIQDAFNLGWKLALLVEGPGSNELIESYEAERRPVGRSIVRSGDEAYARIDPGANELRQGLVDFLSTPEGRSCAASAESEIDFAYVKSPLIEEIGTQHEALRRTAIGARVGDVADLVVGARTISLYDLVYGLTPIILVLGMDDSPESVDAARALLKRLTQHLGSTSVNGFVVSRRSAGELGATEYLLLDPTGLLHERLGQEGPSLCMVRPDGHLGFRSSPPSLDALKAYLARIYRRSV